MDKRRFGILLSLGLIVSIISVIPVITERNQNRQSASQLEFDFYSLVTTFGNEIPVVVRFSVDMNSELMDEMTSLGIEFSLGNAYASSIGDYYLLRGSPEGLTTIAEKGFFRL